MILPKIQGDLQINHHGFYIGCDSVYFEKYCKSLVNSLKIHAPWADIHIHLFNPLPNQIKWCKSKNITVSYETVNLDHEINTYYACVRFIRIPEIFTNSSKIISIDCDGIAVQNISKDSFIQHTELSQCTWRVKSNNSLAGAVFFAPDNFRFEFASRLTYYFENDKFAWYLDQKILNELVAENKVAKLENTNWCNSKCKKDTLIWSSKGDNKEINGNDTKSKITFKDLLEKYGKS